VCTGSRRHVSCRRPKSMAQTHSDIVSPNNLALLALCLTLCVFLASCGSLVSNGSLPSNPTTFVTTGAMKLYRVDHTANLLTTGDVLIDGGGWKIGSDPHVLDGNGNPILVDVPTAGCELYSSASGAFTPCPSSDSARYFHTATSLQNGTVLIAGGVFYEPGIYPFIISFAPAGEIFDPAQGFSSVTFMNAPRAFHTSTLLNNGMVLIAGGQVVSGNVTNSAELYDPTTKAFTLTGNLNAARENHTSTLLNNGMVLIAGGLAQFQLTGAADVPLSTAELYNSVTGMFNATGTMNAPREQHTATLLNNGMVLISGGLDAGGKVLDSAELYDPVTETFTQTGSMSAARANHTATLLDNGVVLIAGGRDSNFTALNSAELYNPTTGLFTTITASLNTARFSHTATLLDNGKVLLAGGDASAPATPNTSALSSAELY
jgi:hypothetical protein